MGVKLCLVKETDKIVSNIKKLFFVFQKVVTKAMDFLRIADRLSWIKVDMKDFNWLQILINLNGSNLYNSISLRGKSCCFCIQKYSSHAKQRLI